MDELIYTNIAKELSGEATEAERRAIKEWLAEDPKHAAIYEDVKLSWQKADKLFSGPAFDCDKAWSRVAAAIGCSDAENGKKGKAIAFMPWLRYSAVAAVLVLGVFLLTRTFGESIVTIAANDKNTEVTLPDGSHITVRKGSTLRYPKAFASNERKVALEGEAFFEVARNEKCPFVIDAQAATVKVLGTSFNVTCTEAAASVVVSTGKVQMADKKQASVILTPGEKGSLQDGKLSEETVQPGNYLYWKTGILSFSNQPLDNIISEMSGLTGSSIRFDSSLNVMHRQQVINISFNNQPVEDMLTELCLISQCQWNKNGDSYVISAK